MRALIALVPLLALGACTTPARDRGIDFTTTAGQPLQANTAPRGSEEFCRNYGRQTAANLLDRSSDADGGSGAGTRLFNAQNRGEYAYERCKAGRLN